MLKNMNIGQKLILTFVLVTVISSIGGIVGLSVMMNMNSTYSKDLQDYGFSQGDVGLFNTEFNYGNSVIRDIVFTTDPQVTKAGLAKLSDSDSKLETYLTNMKKGMATQKEIGYYNDIKANMNQFNEIRKQVVALASQNYNNAAQKLLTEQAVPFSDKIMVSTNALITEKRAEGNRIAAELTTQATIADIMIIAVILATLVISLFIALGISHSISKPVKEMADAAQKMAEGDLNVQINVSSKDEIGKLGTAFSQTIETIRAYIMDIKENLEKVGQGDLTAESRFEYKGDFIELQNSINGIVMSLKDTLTQIDQASEQVLNSSEQVSDGAQALAQGATEQASSIEELSASISEITTHVKDNAEHAATASMNVNHVSEEIEVSNRQMNDMIDAMDKINSSSSQIGKIIKTIEDIAFQTNILALNAAVEAARAGTAGKGFAVVAEEVRNLASKSAEAAKDTTHLIENSMNQVEYGTRIADETANSLHRVVESTKIVLDTVEQISHASNRQLEAIAQVSLGVDQIAGVVQTNSATAEESASASEELSQQAQTLKELVKKFKLEDTEKEQQDTCQGVSSDSVILV